METPRGNKHHQTFPEQVGDNAKLLEELLQQIQWRRFLNWYAALFGILLISIFLLIVVVRFALWLHF